MFKTKSILLVEEDFWTFSKSLNFFDYLNPINIEEAKKEFFSSINNKVINNPILHYQKINFNINETINKFLDFKKYFNSLNTFESTIYCKVIDKNIDWIRNIQSRKDKRFIPWLSNLNSAPSKEKMLSAVDEFKKLKPVDVLENLTSKAAKTRIDKELNLRNYCSWTSELADITAKMYIDSPNNRILINKNKTFSDIELNRLVVHEIDTHVLRYENGKRQDSLIYAYGFPDYIETEEGLALYSEYRTKLLTDKDLAKYCARNIAAYYTLHLSFYDLFLKINSFVDKEMAFDIVVRAKRGLINTSEKGGFTKDHVYYSGLKLIKTLSSSEIKELYIGKVGVHDLKNIPHLSQKLELNTKIPLWIQNTGQYDSQQR